MRAQLHLFLLWLYNAWILEYVFDYRLDPLFLYIYGFRFDLFYPSIVENYLEFSAKNEIYYTASPLPTTAPQLKSCEKNDTNSHFPAVAMPPLTHAGGKWNFFSRAASPLASPRTHLKLMTKLNKWDFLRPYSRLRQKTSNYIFILRDPYPPPRLPLAPHPRIGSSDTRLHEVFFPPRSPGYVSRYRHKIDFLLASL